MKKGKQFFSGLCLVGLMSLIPLSVFASEEDAQTMHRYGTQIVGINKKKVFSDYWHEEAVHRSSVTIGDTYSSSAWVPAEIWSEASAVGVWLDTTHAYFDYDYNREL